MTSASKRSVLANRPVALGEVAYLARIDHHDRQPDGGSCPDQQALPPAGRFAHDQHKTELPDETRNMPSAALACMKSRGTCERGFEDNGAHE